MRQRSNEPACGPAALRHALAILGKRTSLANLKELCAVTRNGTSTKNMIAAIHKLGLSTMVVRRATLRHLQSALRYSPNKIRAVVVSYLYDLNDQNTPNLESGHWATVSGYLASKSRVVLFDSIKGQKKSYDWGQFRERWTDYDFKKRRVGKRGKFKIVRRWQPQLMMVVGKDVDDLPKFRISSARLYA
jgi:ABC-type bacteriocin/lantibiotic exporter with double-glycine peptidase domain